MAAINDLSDLRRELQLLANPQSAVFLQRFFKTGPGQYAEGDRFLGIRVPKIRAFIRPARALPIESVMKLLRSEWHEERLLALLLMVDRYRRGTDEEKDEIHRSYLAHTEHINNWDLVDCSAEHIVGGHLDPSRIELLHRLAKSDSLWDRRIAMLATFHWIKRGVFHPALEIATVLIDDSHDLIHKAVGWMLREIGKRDQAAEEAFLHAHYMHMPRTMLRYAIERFPEGLRQAYLKGAV
jgi:3-methyladenine DNA glycosylase AlkD